MTREQAIKMLRGMKAENLNLNDLYTRDKYEALVIAIKALKKEPKGHWKLVQRGKCIDICCSNCKAVRIKEWAYNYTIDQILKEDIKGCLECADMSYCPYCGSDNRDD